jgi:glutamate racemase
VRGAAPAAGPGQERQAEVASMYVGLFDSGVGGLSVWREVVKLVPGVDTVYVADQVHVPYGVKNPGEVRQLSEAITHFLLDEGAGMVVVACNTASAAALHHLRQLFPDVPFVGMEPAVKPAVAQSSSGVVGVLATPATFQGEHFASLVQRYAGQAKVVTQVCPGLVEAVEEGALYSEDTRKLIARCIAPMLQAGADQLVLGCTHYPFLRRAIVDAAGPGVTVVDPSPAVARQVAHVLASSGLISEETRSGIEEAASGHHLFYTTGELAPFAGLLERLIGLASMGNAEVRAANWDGGALHARRAD